MDLPLSWPPTDGAYLSLGDVLDTVQVTVNGTAVTVNQSDRGRIDLGKTLRPGRNAITVRVATTMFNAVRRTGDSNYQLADWQRAGLSGPVVLTPYRDTVLQTSASGGVGGTVAAALSLTLGAPATFGAFTPGVDRAYDASTTATVTSTAADATLSVDGGRLANGAFTLREPVEVAFSKRSWSGPVSGDLVTIAFKQNIGADEELRTGTYSKTMTFTLSTTTP